MVCAAPWLTTDSSQESVLSFNLSTPITLSRSLKALFGFFFSSLITLHSIFITHHLKYPNFLYPPIWHTYLFITQFFYFFVGLIPLKWSNPSVKKISFNHKTKIVRTTTATIPISPKIQTWTHKNFRSSLALSAPSLVNNTHLSNVYGDAMGWVFFFKSAGFFCVDAHVCGFVLVC